MLLSMSINSSLDGLRLQICTEILYFVTCGLQGLGNQEVSAVPEPTAEGRLPSSIDRGVTEVWLLTHNLSLPVSYHREPSEAAPALCNSAAD